MLYDKKMISEITKVKPNLIGRTKFLFRHIHPMMSIKEYFDVEYKRLNRLMIVLYQTALIAFLCTIIFGKSYRTDEFEDPSRSNYDD